MFQWFFAFLKSLFCSSDDEPEKTDEQIQEEAW